MYLPPLVIHPHGHHMEVLPVDVRVAIDRIRLVSVAESLYDIRDELLDLLFCQMLVRSRIN